MYIQYPDHADPFSINDGAKQAEWFAERFNSSTDAADQCTVLSEAINNTNGEENCDKFCELVHIPRHSVVFETMLTIGDRLHEWDPKETYWDWSMLLFALVDDGEMDDILRVTEHLDRGAIEAAMLLLGEMRLKRSSSAADDLKPSPKE